MNTSINKYNPRSPNDHTLEMVVFLSMLLFAVFYAEFPWLAILLGVVGYGIAQFNRYRDNNPRLTLDQQYETSRNEYLLYVLHARGKDRIHIRQITLLWRDGSWNQLYAPGYVEAPTLDPKEEHVEKFHLFDYGKSDNDYRGYTVQVGNKYYYYPKALDPRRWDFVLNIALVAVGIALLGSLYLLLFD